MEWLDGCTVGEKLSSNGPFSVEDTAIILRQIASALDAIHNRGLIHRDIKPNNIMLAMQRNGNEQVKLIDFGISLAIDDSKSVSKSMATPEYASPEQMRMADSTSN